MNRAEPGSRHEGETRARESIAARAVINGRWSQRGAKKGVCGPVEARDAHAVANICAHHGVGKQRGRSRPVNGWSRRCAEKGTLRSGNVVGQDGRAAASRCDTYPKKVPYPPPQRTSSYSGSTSTTSVHITMLDGLDNVNSLSPRRGSTASRTPPLATPASMLQGNYSYLRSFRLVFSFSLL
ncbi:hypothetical protein BUALT_Bualt13G0111100 [Buddleja alternifolia]|uniref:Uncharacterized protein n=1 Tax=Buddleja alternifolia TaxID=168488 RepID=A0AAV6WNB8_9LAMI|nr:hypothetical protein BUALT_Bualt13G0111100 [Buddleja alternifolia]